VPVVIPNGISLDLLGEGPRISPLSERPEVAVIVSRLVSGKLVVEAAKALLTSDKLKEVRIIGDGPHAKRVEALARDDARVNYLGPKDRGTVLSELRKAKYFVHASTYPDGLPTVLLEAALCGSYICGSGPGVKNFLHSASGQKLGFYFEKLDDLSNFVATSDANMSERQQQVNALSRKLSSRYSWAFIAQEFREKLASIKAKV
jgi:glycosyltransferase involved in cell wall biosynthesis